MKQPRLLWRIYLSFLVITCAAYAVTAWFAARSLQRFHIQEVTASLRAQAQLAGRGSARSEWQSAALTELCRDYARLTGTRFTVILRDGRVWADSEEDPARMANHGDRPEVMAVWNGTDIRFSATLQQRFIYLAIPILREDRVVAVMRASLPLTVVDQALAALYRNLAAGGLLVAVLFALLAFYLSCRLNHPLEAMRLVAERFAAGDLAARVPIPTLPEFAVLADTLNKMAKQLDDRIATIVKQRNQQMAVFESMVEGVITVDTRESITEINPAAARMLDLDAATVNGRSLLESVRHPEIHRFVADTLSLGGPAEREIVLRGHPDTHIQLHGTPLQDRHEKRIGALIVMNDITRLKQLESVRRDFVANVSHELKTPITAIRGYLETLSDAMPDDPGERQRFLQVVRNHADRLHAIVDDLLSLSRIEFDAERGSITLETCVLRPLLARVLERMAPRAAARNIAIDLACAPDLSLQASAVLLEQAVGNLIDNAMKYSPEGTRVAVEVRHAGANIEISVSDQGCGIERQHLTRIFERFYRIDQGRSRALGGTGLGLAIVRHIALAHRGSVAVASTPAQGSVFTLTLPAS